jgi:glutathione S-transferase
VSAALDKTSAAWNIVDRQLTNRPYVAGSDLTLGDIPLGVWAYRWFNLPIEQPKFANLEGWYKRLCARPAYQKHIMIPLT